jgi:hypothetical protein
VCDKPCALAMQGGSCFIWGCFYLFFLEMLTRRTRRKECGAGNTPREGVASRPICFVAYAIFGRCFLHAHDTASTATKVRLQSEQNWLHMGGHDEFPGGRESIRYRSNTRPRRWRFTKRNLPEGYCNTTLDSSCRKIVSQEFQCRVCEMHTLQKPQLTAIKCGIPHPYTGGCIRNKNY